MASSKDYLEFILEQLSGLNEITECQTNRKEIKDGKI